MRRILGSFICLSLLTGCSNSVAQLSESDAAFVSEMIPHHDLGMRLIDDATLNSYDVRLRRMVFEMSSYHEDELHRLHALADSGDVAIATNFAGSIPSASINRLSRLDGLAHDTWWLNIMIVHHEGAVEIAESALRASKNSDVTSIAASVTTVQSRELAEMRRLLAEMCATNVSLAGC